MQISTIRRIVGKTFLLLTVLLFKQVWAEEVRNTLGMEFVLIPSGTFVMGRTESLKALRAAFPAFEDWRFGPLDDELPSHEVEITKALKQFSSGSFFYNWLEVDVGKESRLSKLQNIV